MNTNTAKIIAGATDPNRHGWTTTTTPYTEVMGAMYCVVHCDFALEGTEDGHQFCDGHGDFYEPYATALSVTDCDLRDLFIQSGTR
jgi:hypothetical protein